VATAVTLPPSGPIAAAPPAPGQPMLRWASRAHSVDEVAVELGKIWSSISLTAPGPDGEAERRVAARSSVMNLVVIAGRGEVGERAASIVDGLAGRHPSRTLLVVPADPDGPPWLDAQVQAHCVLPSATAPETCSELVYLTCGGESAQHMAGLVTPLLIHDLPVTVWWPNEPRFESGASTELLAMADRILVDGSGWSGDGLARLATMTRLRSSHALDIADFAMLRQARWREAIASVFDRPTLLPFVNSIDRIEVHYAAKEGTPGAANVVRPLYHVAWLAARLGMTVLTPIRAGTEPWSGYEAMLRHGRRRVPVHLQPVEAAATPSGTTLVVELHATRGRSQLWIEVTAYAEGVIVHAMLDSEALPERRFLAPRRREADLLAETIDEAGRDELTAEVLDMLAGLLGG
jgi:Glucose-6-phosphate dehydrogenase subunit N-terminal domain/Glucose-6-phosphate dehydrogenase subunit C-terminal domain